MSYCIWLRSDNRDKQTKPIEPGLGSNFQKSSVHCELEPHVVHCGALRPNPGIIDVRVGVRDPNSNLTLSLGL